MPRIATLGDIDGLLRLMEPFNAGEAIPWHPERTREALTRLFSTPELGFVVLTEDLTPNPKPIGYAVVTYNFDLEFGGLDCILTEIYVSPGFRGRGLARELLQHAQASAKAAGAAAMSLAVRPSNTS
ncbi:MAG: GNAT family N-acetyltransferase, partial [Myxococcales bacterium]|nr:GNAT family N-acetyltransferase [Myxococcales bacterium]